MCTIPYMYVHVTSAKSPSEFSTTGWVKVAFSSFLHIFLIHKMWKRLRCRSVHFLGTCVRRTAAKWRLKKKKVFRLQN